MSALEWNFVVEFFIERLAATATAHGAGPAKVSAAAALPLTRPRALPSD
jgi:hypothetical protein